MVPDASDKVPRASPSSGSAGLPHGFGYGTCTLSGRPFQCRSPTMILAVSRSFNPRPRSGLGSSLSLAATQGITVVFFSSGYLDVSVPRYLSLRLFVHLRMTAITHAGSPIRIPADLCYSSPPRFAVCCVLLQFQVPRHPPYALS